MLVIGGVSTSDLCVRAYWQRETHIYSDCLKKDKTFAKNIPKPVNVTCQLS